MKEKPIQTDSLGKNYTFNREAALKYIDLPLAVIPDSSMPTGIGPFKTKGYTVYAWKKTPEGLEERYEILTGRFRRGRFAKRAAEREIKKLTNGNHSS